jgi:Rieske Fe-S protein
MTQHLTRRSALRGLSISGCAAVVGFAVGWRKRPAGGRGAATAANAYGAAPTSGRSLTPLDRVPAGGGLVLTGPKIVLTRGSGDAVHAFSAVCTHQGCTVGSVDGGSILCPCHGSRFDAQTGAVTAGPATRPLAAVPIVVRNGTVFTT